MTYMSRGWRKEAKELQIEAVNQLRTTLGDGHPLTVVAIANLASFREERTLPAPFCEPKDLMERLRDRIQQFAASLSLDHGKGDQKRFESLSMIDGKDDNEIGSFQAPSIEPDEGNETNGERLKRARAMSMMGNDNGEIGSFQATSIEPDEGGEPDEPRLQRALAMSIRMKMAVKNWLLQKRIFIYRR